MPKLLVTLPDSGDVPHDLAEPVITLGRLDENALQIDDPSVSSRHAQFTLQETGNYLLRDLNSTNGTRVNGERIMSEVALRPGDRVRFGKIEAVYESPIPAGGDEPATGGDVPVADLAAGGDEPTPEAAAPVAAVAERSQRPADFANAAPFKKTERTRDPVGRAMLAFAAVAFLLFLVALFFVFRLQPPGGLPT